MLDIAVLLEEFENRQDFPCAFFHVNALPFMEDTRDVFVETASGNVRNSVYVTISDDVENLFHINSGRGQCYFTERFVTEFRIYLVKVKCSICENLADKAESV